MFGIGRKAILPFALAAGAGVPYLYSSSDQLMEQAGSLVPTWESSDTDALTHDSPAVEHEILIPGLPPREQKVSQHVVMLEEAFRFDISPAWVMARWQRVTTQLSSIEYQGLRVNLITGGSSSDLAGALTYYFDESDQLKQISFRGTTGEPSRLIHWLQSKYEFRPQKSAPGVTRYVVRWNGKEISELEFHTAGVIDRNDPLGHYDVYLTMRTKEDWL